MAKRVTLLVLLIGLVGGLLVWWQRDAEPEAVETASEGDASSRAQMLARKKAERAKREIDLRPCSISGRVVEAGGTGIAGAVVRLVASDNARRPPTGEPSGREFVVTDAAGNWSIAAAQPGTYLVSAAADGHVPGHIDAVVLAPADALTGVEIALVPGGLALTGTVSDHGGGPIEGVLVSATSRAPLPGPDAIRPSYAALTDAEGRYELWLADAPFTISTWHVDYTSKHEDVAMKGRAQLRDFRLVPGSVVQGVVIEAADGTPVADARVTIARQRRGVVGGPRGEPVHTDAQGRFTFRQLEAGVQTLRATAPGLATVTPTEVPLAIGEQVAGVRVEVAAAFDVSGSVVRADDPERGVAQATVGLFSMREDGRYESLPTEADGYFVIHGLVPGAYLGAPRGAGILKGFGSGTPVTIEDHAIDDLLLEVELGVEIRGRVEPPMPVRVSVESIDEQGDLWQTRRRGGGSTSYARDDGSFTVTGAEPGRWKLVATATDGDGKGEIEVEIPAAGLDDVVIALQMLPRVAGRVVDLEGNPLSELRVVLEDRSKSAGERRRKGKYFGPVGNSSMTQTDGSFEILQVEDGDYVVRLVADRSPLELDGADAATGGIPLSIHRGVGVADLQLRARVRRGTIRGRVVAVGGGPAPDVWVTARPVGDQRPFAFGGEEPALTDLDGRFRFEQLEDARYQLTAEAADASARATLEDVGLGADVTIELAAPSRITGTVRHQGVAVTEFVLESGTGPMGFGGKRVVDPTGHFALERLVPGKHTILVTSEHGSARATVALDAGEHAQLTLDLVGWGKITGTAVSAETGEPLSGIKVSGQSSGGSKSGDAELFSLLQGKGNATDAAGRFEIDGLGAGVVHVTFLSGSLTDGHELGGTECYLEAGQTKDVGTLRLLGGDAVPETDRGDLGLWATTAFEGPTKDDPRGPEPSGPPTTPLRLWIASVDPGGPAAKAGLEPFTEILAVDGKRVDEYGAGSVGVLLEGARVNKGQPVQIELAGGRVVVVVAD